MINEDGPMVVPIGEDTIHRLIEGHPVSLCDGKLVLIDADGLRDTILMRHRTFAILVAAAARSYER